MPGQQGGCSPCAWACIGVDKQGMKEQEASEWNACGSHNNRPYGGIAHIKLVKRSMSGSVSGSCTYTGGGAGLDGTAGTCLRAGTVGASCLWGTAGGALLVGTAGGTFTPCASARFISSASMSVSDCFLPLCPNVGCRAGGCGGAFAPPDTPPDTPDMAAFRRCKSSMRLRRPMHFSNCMEL